MKTFSVYGKVVGTKYLGEVIAKNKKEAIKKADLREAWVSVCHQCSKEISDPEIVEIIVEEK